MVGTGSGSCLVASCGGNDVETSGSAVRDLVSQPVLELGNYLLSEMAVCEMGCEQGKWTELSQDRVQSQVLVV